MCDSEPRCSLSVELDSNDDASNQRCTAQQVQAPASYPRYATLSFDDSQRSPVDLNGNDEASNAGRRDDELLLAWAEPTPLAPAQGDSVQPQNLYRADVDGLRAVAVLAVVMYHLDHKWLPGGFTGVDIFFVISGYVVASSLTKHHVGSIAPFIVSFYARRVKRLTPALVFTVLLTSFAIPTLLPVGVDKSDYYISGQLGMVGWANNHFAVRGTGYTDEGPEGLLFNPFTHLWSLGVEEQFYFAFPFLLAYTLRLRAARGMTSFWSFAPLVLVTLLSFATSSSLTYTHQQLAFYLMPSRFWQLVSGATLLLLQEQLQRDDGGEGSTAHFFTCRPSPRAALLAVSSIEALVVALLVASLVLPTADRDFPVPWSFCAILGTLGAIALGCHAWFPPQRWLGTRIPSPMLPACLAHPPLPYIGKLSYPLYLVHWPIIVFLRWNGGVHAATHRLAAVGSSVALAMVVHHCIERPLHRRKWPNWRIFATLGLAVLVLEMWLLVLLVTPVDILWSSPPSSALQPPQSSTSRPQGMINADDIGSNATGALGNSGVTSGDFSGGISGNISGNVSVASPPPPSPSPPPQSSCACSNIPGWAGHTLRSPSYENSRAITRCFDLQVDGFDLTVGENGWMFWLDCFLSSDAETRTNFLYAWQREWSVAQADRASRCLMPARGRQNQRALFLVGDSKAANLHAGMERALRGKMAYAMVSRGMCGLYPVAVRRMVCSQDSEATQDAWTTYVLSVLNERLETGDVLALITLRDLHLRPDVLAWYDAELLPLVRARRAKLLLIADNLPLQMPGSQYVILQCLQSPSSCSSSYEAASTRTGGLMGLSSQAGRAAGQAFAASRSEVFFYDGLPDLFCTNTDPDGVCGPNVPGTAITAYHDYTHLRRAGSYYTWPYFCAAFQDFGFFA